WVVQPCVNLRAGYHALYLRVDYRAAAYVRSSVFSETAKRRLFRPEAAESNHPGADDLYHRIPGLRLHPGDDRGRRHPPAGILLLSLRDHDPGGRNHVLHVARRKDYG